MTAMRKSEIHQNNKCDDGESLQQDSMEMWFLLCAWDDFVWDERSGTV